VAQTASVTLPADTARTVTETVAVLQADLTDRAEDLRRLLAAMRTPSLPGGSDATLVAALRAYASEVVGSDREPAPTVTVLVDPALRLDWATMTIAYRIAQEAIYGATRHGGARAVAVSVTAVDGGQGGVEVQVNDDGGGIGPGDEARRAGLRAVELFTQLGRGDLVVDGRRGRTVVRARLGVARRGAGAGDTSEQLVPVPATRVAARGRASGERRRHLHLVPADDPSAG
jgi:signal transduction histidine kinase